MFNFKWRNFKYYRRGQRLWLWGWYSNGSRTENSRIFRKFEDIFINKIKIGNPQLPQNRWKSRPFSQVKVPKFEIKPFSGNPVEWKTFNESFTAAVDKNISILTLKKMGYLMGFL